MGAGVVSAWLLLNAGLLLVIGLIYYGWKRTRPLTGGELMRQLKKESGSDPQAPDLTMGEIAFLLRETRHPAEEQLLAAVLSGWQADGRLTCKMAPKKRLVSFGDDIQPTIYFAELPKRPDGAEEALLALFEGTCDGTLQSSEGYNWARDHASELHDILRRFEAEGRARLRAMGAVRDETRKALFGAGTQVRLIYTARGLRRAQAMQRWRNHLAGSPEDAVRFAVLFGCGTPPEPLGRFCEQLLKGYTSGLKSQKAKLP